MKKINSFISFIALLLCHAVSGQTDTVFIHQTQDTIACKNVLFIMTEGDNLIK